MKMHRTNGQNGNFYLLNQDPETETKSLLETHKARMAFSVLKEASPEHFSNLMRMKTIVPILNREAALYYEEVTRLLETGMLLAEAEEMEWPKLLSRIGVTEK